MGSLAQITYYLRVGGKIAGIIAGVALAVFLLFQGGTYVFRLIRPPKPPAPQQIFGKVPPIVYPQQNKTLAEYKIDTITGKLPSLPDRLRVYRIVSQEPSLFALQNLRAHLRPFGYTFGEREIDQLEKIYTWQNNYGNTIKYNALQNTFEIYPNPQLQVPPPELHFADQTEALKYVQTFLDGLELDVADIDFAKTRISYYKIDSSGAKEVKNYSQANSAQINLYQTDLEINPISVFDKTVEKLPVVYPSISENQITTLTFTVRLTSNGPNISQARFFHYMPDLNSFSDYPIKSISSAFEDLQNGKAYYMGSNNSPIVGITNISLGYYLGEEKQTYAQPVIIFEGTNFKAYVSALTY